MPPLLKLLFDDDRVVVVLTADADVQMARRNRTLVRRKQSSKALECKEIAKRVLSLQHRAKIEHMSETWEWIAQTIEDAL